MAAKKIKRKPKKIFIFLLLIIVIAIACGIYFKFFNHNQIKETKVVSKIPKYGYTLKSNKSKAYKQLFQELKEVLSKDKVDEKEYASVITKMFITDFYSLDDHIAKTDVGGTDFIHTKILDNFLMNAEDTLYKYVESNIYKQRTQKLPVVDQVKIDRVQIVEYTYNEEDIDEESYQVEASWTYQDEQSSKGYQKRAFFTYVHEGKKLSLVEISDQELDSKIGED